MRTKSKHIPVNTLPAGTREGIVVMRKSFNGSPGSKAVERSHRDNGFVFILQEKGITHIAIDFLEYAIAAPSVIFIHPDQIHRVISFDDATISSWMITSENLQPELLKLLEDLTPVHPLALNAETSAVISATASTSLQILERKQEKLFDVILKESVNTLVALVISQYLSLTPSIVHASRFEVITKAFKSALAKHFATVKSAGDYAGRLNISTPYLNECVKSTTGQPVSYHIQQRVILEAKRLLYHSGKSIKEIAAELGYADHNYFTRLFVKTTGRTPLAFRSQNLD